MAEYIELDALLEKIEGATGIGSMASGLLRRLVERVPTADVVEVLHGEWLICADGYYPYCSRCGKEPKNGELTNYCPDCGARMDGK